MIESEDRILVDVSHIAVWIIIVWTILSLFLLRKDWIDELGISMLFLMSGIMFFLFALFLDDGFNISDLFFEIEYCDAKTSAELFSLSLANIAIAVFYGWRYCVGEEKKYNREE